MLRFSNAVVVNATSVALGFGAVDGGTCSSVAVGNGATVSTTESYDIALGYQATITQGAGCLAIGATANAAPPAASQSISLGYGTSATSSKCAMMGSAHAVVEYGPHCGYLNPDSTYVFWNLNDYNLPAKAVAQGFHDIDEWDMLITAGNYSVIFPTRDSILAYVPNAIAGTAWYFTLTLSNQGARTNFATTDATVTLKLLNGYIDSDAVFGRVGVAECLCLYTGSVIEIYFPFA